MALQYRRDPPSPAAGLEDEDNYQIEVWDREGGEFLGFALKTSMSGVVHDAFREAVERYPGKHLVQTNGPYAIKAVTAPTGEPDQFGWISGNDVALEGLPEWYGLVAKCSCGNMARIDRHDPKVSRWKGYPLSAIAAKLSCSECKKARRDGSSIELGLYKLPR